VTSTETGRSCVHPSLHKYGGANQNPCDVINPNGLTSIYMHDQLKTVKNVMLDIIFRM